MLLKWEKPKQDSERVGAFLCTERVEREKKMGRWEMGAKTCLSERAEGAEVLGGLG